jgi:isopenicillin-N epimerase
MNNLRDAFYIRIGTIQINNGSFGKCPKPVFQEYQRWQLEFEQHPDGFVRKWFDHMDEARAVLAEYLHTSSRNLAFVTNATMGVNIATHSLRSWLKPGDEILTTDHEYNACNNAWLFCCEKSGAKYFHQPMPLPVTTTEEFVERFWQGVTPKTKVIYLSHITSPTALTFPVKEICARARAANILTVIDGAHAPGQIELDLDDLGADFYTGNCHKWMCAPKGTAFFYARPDAQHMIEPLIVGHNYAGERKTGNPMLDLIEFFGTRDLAGFLAVPAAIRFMCENDWDTVRARCHTFVSQMREQLSALVGTQDRPICPNHDDTWFSQMAALRLPHGVDTDKLRESFWSENLEAIAFTWNGNPLLRISVQAYNTSDDFEHLMDALKRHLKLGE